MLPRVKIQFANGALGQVEAMADGTLGFIALGCKEVDDTFTLGKAYSIRQLSDLEALGVSKENNPELYRQVLDFYAEAPNGTKLWLMGFPATETFTSVFDKDTASGAIALVKAAKGELRALVAFKTPEESYELTLTKAIDADVISALPKAQALAELATDELYAPLFTLFEGYGFSGSANELEDLTKTKYNRVGVVIGDTASGSKNAAIGIVAGKVATTAVQQKISRVKDGALSPLEFFIGDKASELADLETINNKGYISFRTFVGKAGYFIADDNLATEIADDYRSITNRRVIDKAFRIAYGSLIEVLNEQVPVAQNGELSPAFAANLEATVENAIINNMTANGNLGSDPGDATDTGVKCSIPYAQNILSNSFLEMFIKVKPSGYAKYIDVTIGFKTA